MGLDIWLVIRWWGTLFFVGSVAYPLTKKLFPRWWDRGYLFAKAVGMALVTYIVYLFGILHIVPFTQLSVFIALFILFIAGLAANLFGEPSVPRPGARVPGWMTRIVVILSEELFFFAALLFWSWVKGHEPSIHGLEKFMDFGFTKSILNSAWFPAPDMWYAGFPINYYYFGHTVMAVLTRLSGIDLAYTFNLMLASLFAFTFTMSFSIGQQLLLTAKREMPRMKPWVATAGGLFSAFLVTLAGNMQTVYAFTKGYTGDSVVPFWTILWPVGEFIQRLPEGLDRYWYANATRFIPFTIHEFPSYSFVVSDVHGHVLSLPFVLLAIALCIAMFGRDRIADLMRWETRWLRTGFYGLLVAVLLMTNALDGPIYLGLFLLILLFADTKIDLKDRLWWKAKLTESVPVLVAAGLGSVPFMAHFKSFVSGLAINCPPTILADHKIGVFLFEGVEKCQHSPLWMMALLWGFFIYCGVWFLIAVKKYLDTKNTQMNLVLTVFFFFSLALIIFPEFFYFKDIYPAHFRSNTMFKLGYQAFIMFSILAGYTIVRAILAVRARMTDKRIRVKNRIFLLFLVPLLFLVSIYPIFSVRSYFDSLRHYRGLYGLTWLAEQYPDDYGAILWLDSTIKLSAPDDLPVIVEADGDSYTDYERISAFTGLPAVVGWPVHEWLWRGTYDVVAPRRSEVQTIYDPQYMEATRAILAKYHVRYIIVGTMEREKYPNLSTEKFAVLGKEVFHQGETSIYDVSAAGY